MALTKSIPIQSSVTPEQKLQIEAVKRIECFTSESKAIKYIIKRWHDSLSKDDKIAIDNYVRQHIHK